MSGQVLFHPGHSLLKLLVAFLFQSVKRRNISHVYELLLYSDQTIYFVLLCLELETEHVYKLFL